MERYTVGTVSTGLYPAEGTQGSAHMWGKETRGGARQEWLQEMEMEMEMEASTDT